MKTKILLLRYSINATNSIYRLWVFLKEIPKLFKTIFRPKSFTIENSLFSLYVIERFMNRFMNKLKFILIFILIIFLSSCYQVGENNCRNCRDVQQISGKEDKNSENSEMEENSSSSSSKKKDGEISFELPPKVAVKLPLNGPWLILGVIFGIIVLYNLFRRKNVNNNLIVLLLTLMCFISCSFSTYSDIHQKNNNIIENLMNIFLLIVGVFSINFIVKFIIKFFDNLKTLVILIFFIPYSLFSQNKCKNCDNVVQISNSSIKVEHKNTSITYTYNIYNYYPPDYPPDPVDNKHIINFLDITNNQRIENVEIYGLNSIGSAIFDKGQLVIDKPRRPFILKAKANGYKEVSFIVEANTNNQDVKLDPLPTGNIIFKVKDTTLKSDLKIKVADKEYNFIDKINYDDIGRKNEYNINISHPWYEDLNIILKIKNFHKDTVLNLVLKPKLIKIKFLNKVGPLIVITQNKVDTLPSNKNYIEFELPYITKNPKIILKRPNFSTSSEVDFNNIEKYEIDVEKLFYSKIKIIVDDKTIKSKLNLLEKFFYNLEKLSKRDVLIINERVIDFDSAVKKGELIFVKDTNTIKYTSGFNLNVKKILGDSLLNDKDINGIKEIKIPYNFKITKQETTIRLEDDKGNLIDGNLELTLSTDLFWYKLFHPTIKVKVIKGYAKVKLFKNVSYKVRLLDMDYYFRNGYIEMIFDENVEIIKCIKKQHININFALDTTGLGVEFTKEYRKKLLDMFCHPNTIEEINKFLGDVYVNQNKYPLRNLTLKFMWELGNDHYIKIHVPKLNAYYYIPMARVFEGLTDTTFYINPFTKIAIMKGGKRNDSDRYGKIKLSDTEYIYLGPFPPGPPIIVYDDFTNSSETCCKIFDYEKRVYYFLKRCDKEKLAELLQWECDSLDCNEKLIDKQYYKVLKEIILNTLLVKKDINLKNKIVFIKYSKVFEKPFAKFPKYNYIDSILRELNDNGLPKCLDDRPMPSEPCNDEQIWLERIKKLLTTNSKFVEPIIDSLKKIKSNLKCPENKSLLDTAISIIKKESSNDDFLKKIDTQHVDISRNYNDLILTITTFEDFDPGKYQTITLIRVLDSICLNITRYNIYKIFKIHLNIIASADGLPVIRKIKYDGEHVNKIFTVTFLKTEKKTISSKYLRYMWKIIPLEKNENINVKVLREIKNNKELAIIRLVVIAGYIHGKFNPGELNTVEYFVINNENIGREYRYVAAQFIIQDFYKGYNDAANKALELIKNKYNKK